VLLVFVIQVSSGNNQAILSFNTEDHSSLPHPHPDERMASGNQNNRPVIGITGGSGRVGTVLRKALHPEYKLKLFTFAQFTMNTSSDPIPAEIEQISVDFSDAKQVEGVFSGVDILIHLAALVDVSPYGENWEHMWKNNFEATYNVFQECVRSKVKRMIFASSNHVQNGLVINDPRNCESLDRAKLKSAMQLDDPPFPDSMYAVAKLFGEDLGKLYALQSGLEFIGMRIGWLLSATSDDVSILQGTKSETYMRAIYVSRRDITEFFRHAITAPMKTEKSNGIPFMLAYVCSNNDKQIWDLTETIANLGYTPQDNSEIWFKSSGTND